MGNIENKVYHPDELRVIITNFYKRLFTELHKYYGAVQDYETIYNCWHQYRIRMTDSFEKLIPAIREFNKNSSAFTIGSSVVSACTRSISVLAASSTGGLAVPFFGLMALGSSLVKMGFELGNFCNDDNKRREVLDRLEEDHQKCQALVAVINRCENLAQRIRNLIEQNHCSEFVHEHWDSIIVAITDDVMLQNLEKVRNAEADINDYLVLMPALIPEYFDENREFIVRFRNVNPILLVRLMLYAKMVGFVGVSFNFVMDTIKFVRSWKLAGETTAQVTKPVISFLELASEVYDVAVKLKNFDEDPEIVTAIRNVLVNLERQTTDITEMHDELVRG